MPTGTVPDPYNSYNFLVEIDGIARAAFREASGFDSTVEVIEYREGGENITMRKLPGKATYSNIVLKWGMTDDATLYELHKQVVQGQISRRNGSIVLLNRAGEEVARWNFIRAWVTKYDGPDLNAEGNEVAIETVELAHEGIERVS